MGVFLLYWQTDIFIAFLLSSSFFFCLDFVIEILTPIVNIKKRLLIFP